MIAFNPTLTRAEKFYVFKFSVSCTKQNLKLLICLKPQLFADEETDLEE